jgi:hypothetical protein
MIKSGIEMIEDIVEQVALLNRRSKIIEQNIKELLNRANGITATHRAPVNITDLKPTTATPTINKKTVRASKVMGKIKNELNRAVSGVQINITNENGQIIKATKTNRAGDWMCFLAPGKYAAHYFLKDMIDTNVKFIVTEEQRLIRVAQPQRGE